MSKPYELQKKFEKLEPNFILLDELYKKNPKEYIRRRLKAIKLLWKGYTKNQVIEKLDVHRTKLQDCFKSIVEMGVDEGLKYLARTKKVKRGKKLSQEEQDEIIRILEDTTPQDYGYEQYIFTGKILVEIIKEKYNKDVSDQTVYNLLHTKGLSYQKGHRDYENADPEVQYDYCVKLKKNWIRKKKMKK